MQATALNIFNAVGYNAKKRFLSVTKTDFKESKNLNF